METSYIDYLKENNFKYKAYVNNGRVFRTGDWTKGRPLHYEGYEESEVPTVEKEIEEEEGKEEEFFT